MENFSTKGQVNLWGKEASLSTGIWRGWAWGMLGQGMPDPTGQQRRAPRGAQVGGEGGWSGGRDSSVPSASWTFTLSQEQPRPGLEEGGMGSEEEGDVAGSCQSPVSIVHVCKAWCGHKHSYGGLLLSRLNVGKHSCDMPPPGPWPPRNQDWQEGNGPSAPVSWLEMSPADVSGAGKTNNLHGRSRPSPRVEKEALGDLWGHHLFSKGAASWGQPPSVLTQVCSATLGGVGAQSEDPLPRGCSVWVS